MNKDGLAEFGSLLKQARESKGLSIERVNQELKIRATYLESFEAGRLPDKIGTTYSRQLLRAYAQFLNLETAPIDLLIKPDKTPSRLHHKVQFRPDIVTTKILTFGTLSLLMLGIISYVIWQVIVLSSAPSLVITAPPRDIISEHPRYEIRGKSTSGTDISINDVAILSNPDGSFSESVPLRPGLNTFRVTATNKLGKTRVIERAIIYSDATLDGQ